MNIYYDQIKSLTISQSLCEEYLALCAKFANYKNKSAAKEALGVNVESHHVLPKAFKMGGEKDKSNLTYLPLEEHRHAHKLLKDMFSGKFRRDMAFAYSRIIHRHGAKDSIPMEEYAAIRSEVGKMIGDMNRIKNATAKHRETLSRVKTGTRWIHNGEIERMIGPDDQLPEGWTEERLVCSIKGRIWINNGEKNKMIYPSDPIPEGWSTGIYSAKREEKKKQKQEKGA